MNHPHTHQAAAQEESNVGGAAPASQGINVNIPAESKNILPTEMSFFFRKDKETDTKRDTVKLLLPFLTVDGLVSVLSKGDPKELALILDSVNAQIVAQARVQVNEREDITQENLDMSKLTWEAIANLPQAERRGGGIAKEIWEEFFKDYAKVMAAAAGKDEETLERHLQILTKKFATIRSNKKVLSAFQSFLDIYAAHTTELETFQDCVDFLQTKADTFLKLDDAALLENL